MQGFSGGEEKKAYSLSPIGELRLDEAATLPRSRVSAVPLLTIAGLVWQAVRVRQGLSRREEAVPEAKGMAVEAVPRLWLAMA